MANKYYRKESYVFGIFRVPAPITNKFKKEFVGLNYKIVDLAKIPIESAPGMFTILINLDKKREYIKFTKRINYFIKRHKLTSKSFGIRANLVTARDMDGVRIPDYVIEFYKKVGGTIDFSFISG